MNRRVIAACLFHHVVSRSSMNFRGKGDNGIYRTLFSHCIVLPLQLVAGCLYANFCPLFSLSAPLPRPSGSKPRPQPLPRHICSPSSNRSILFTVSRRLKASRFPLRRFPLSSRRRLIYSTSNISSINTNTTSSKRPPRRASVHHLPSQDPPRRWLRR